jgi:uncharacterized BrkB/YihY/UPF0761 family membrane protein
MSLVGTKRRLGNVRFWAACGSKADIDQRRQFMSTPPWHFERPIPYALISFLFAAIYKVLPDRDLKWGDVVVGAIVTEVLFTIGKSLISWYIGSSAVASSFGAAGALIVLLLWVYYSAQIFLLGAEFTKVYANTHGSFCNTIVGKPDIRQTSPNDRDPKPTLGKIEIPQRSIAVLSFQGHGSHR